jgi:hypothetical protein
MAMSVRQTEASTPKNRSARQKSPFLDLVECVRPRSRDGKDENCSER